MALKQLRIGAVPAAAQWDDGDFDSGLETSEPIKAGPPVDPNDVVRLDDLNFVPLAAANIDNPTELNTLAGTEGMTVLVYSSVPATGLNQYTLYAYDASGPAVSSPYIVDAAGVGDERWIAIAGKYRYGDLYIAKDAFPSIYLVTSAIGTAIYGMRSDGTLALPTALGAGSNALIIYGYGYGTTGFQTLASIQFRSDGVISDVSAPGMLVFNTTPSGSVVLVPRMWITKDGFIGMGPAAGAPLGVLCIDGGLHVGGMSDAGDNNLLVDGTLEITGISLLTGLLKTVGGVHVGGASDPGADNLLVDGTLEVTGVTLHTGLLKTVGGVHVGGASDPGADNLLVDGTLEVTGATVHTGLVKTAGGVHVGGTTDPGADNLLVDGTLEVTGATVHTGLVKTVAGVHVGGTSDPGADNLAVDGTLLVSGNTTLTGAELTRGSFIKEFTALATNLDTTLAITLTYAAPGSAYYGHFLEIIATLTDYDNAVNYSSIVRYAVTTRTGLSPTVTDMTHDLVGGVTEAVSVSTLVVVVTLTMPGTVAIDRVSVLARDVSSVAIAVLSSVSIA